MNNIQESLSFDDVLIEPRYSTIQSRKNIILKSKLTTNISLYLPLISSPMDTITEDSMAIHMAINGGLGILHRYNTIEQQVEMIKKVKRHLSFIIENPYTINENETVEDLNKYIKKYKVNSFLVINKENKLTGIITKRDLNAHVIFDNFLTRYIKDIMTPFNKLYCADEKITRTEAIATMNKYKIEKLPIIDNNNTVLGLINYKSLIAYEQNKDKYSLDSRGRLLVGVSVGIVDDYLERTKGLVDAGCDILCIDVANGYNERVKTVIKELKTAFPTIDIMAGNVCNAEGFEFLCKAGADCIRVGIGNGSICSTRLVTGVGSGQFSSLMKCRKMARFYNVGMISDGGHLGKDGNISKAFVVGADAMMLGKTLAATDETPGNIIYRNNRRVKCYRGMASAMAMVSKAEMTNKEYNGNQNPEGADIEVEIKGPVKDILNRIESSIKSTMSYIGCCTTEELRNVEKEIVYNRQSIGVMNETSIRGKMM
jgi:IMP dehydrogenase